MTMMKNLALALFTVAAVTAPAATPVDYSGHWTLDRTRSRNLPRMYEHVASQQIDVTQTAAVLRVALDIRRAEAPPLQQTLEFDLSGKTTETTSVVRMNGTDRTIPMKLHGAVRDDGRIEVTESRINGDITLTTAELWELSADGKTLTVHRKDELPRGGTAEFDMVFTRG